MASHKLKKLQIVRRIEREDAAEQLFAQAVAAELNNINFAEQSQSLNSIDSRGRACPERSRRDDLGTRGRSWGLPTEDVCDTSGAYAENFAKQSQLLNAIDNRGRACPERSRRDALGTRGRSWGLPTEDVRDTSGAYAENFAEQSQSLNAIDSRGRACPERSRRDARDTSGAYTDDFVKQSQFVPGLMGATSLMERDYNDTAHPGDAENKPNRPAQLFNSQGQSLSRA